MTDQDPAILAIDQGTTSTRAILFSVDGAPLVTQQRELTLHYPQKGWVEQNPDDLWHDTIWACGEILKDGAKPAALGITNQRETTIIWNRASGRPVYNAIVWQDRRTADLCARLKEDGHEAMIRSRTGLLLDPYFSATKIRWILDNVEGAREQAQRGELAFGTVDTWLLWNLTGGRVHGTDATNAARTMLFNIRTQKWDTELLALFDIPRSMLPEVRDNAAAYGEADIGGHRIKIGGMAGDQQAALIGQACFSPGMVKATYGTGCFALMTIGAEFKESHNKLLTTVAYRLNGHTTYALEGSIFVAGAAVQWLRDGLGVITSAAESEKLALSVPDSNGVYFVPAFTGLGAPHWRPDARAVIAGLTRESTAAHIVRAALEAQGFQTADLIDAMAADAGARPAVIRADGGLTANNFVCQFIADILDIPLDIPAVTETTALGAAYLAGIHAGLYDGPEDIIGRWHRARHYSPAMAPNRRCRMYEGWQTEVGRLLS